jgi:phosphatidylserine/phosphatidylglycerophosphate/cardiolipin synthase-like enzyme
MLRLSFFERLQILKGVELSGEELQNILQKYNKNINDKNIIQEIGITGPRRNLIIRAFEHLEKPFQFALSQAWLAIIKDHPKKKIDPQICLTAINPERFAARTTDTFDAFLDLLKKARKRIVIMGYHFNNGNKELIETLEDRLYNDRIDLKILTDHLLSKINKRNHKFIVKWLMDSKLRFHIYSYEHPLKTELMHIKSMLIDQKTIYVGSANFTKGGLKSNIELGIILTNEDLNSKIDSIFNHIIGGKIDYIIKINYSFLKQKNFI